MKINLKEWIAKVNNAIKSFNAGEIIDGSSNSLIVNVAYTTGTANTWVKSGTFIIPKEGIYRVRAGYNNSSVYGWGYSPTTTTSIVAAGIMQENPTAASTDVIVWLPAGTWSFWTKCGTASKSNNFMIWQLFTIK